MTKREDEWPEDIIKDCLDFEETTQEMFEAKDLDDANDLRDGCAVEDIIREYQERVMSDLLDSVKDFLSFSTPAELIKLIASEL